MCANFVVLVQFGREKNYDFKLTINLGTGVMIAPRIYSLLAPIVILKRRDTMGQKECQT